MYAFETDLELHFPEGTNIKLWLPGNIVFGYVVSCENFTIVFKTKEYIGKIINSIEISFEQWKLLEALIERLDEMNPDKNSIAYEIACNGRKYILKNDKIKCGQDVALKKAALKGVTFIWGPPGTGKTEALADITHEHLSNGRRVLMLSYSNVSVDEAVLRVAKKHKYPEGTIVRYGYPRRKELLESKSLHSFQYVLHKNSEKLNEYQILKEKIKKLKPKDPKRVDINKKLKTIHDYLIKKEKELIMHSSFVATTVSKAVMDNAIFMQQFDVVIFDEASMAYVPQIVFSAGIAKEYFVCIGDFNQLPAIVQTNNDDRLTKNIFEYTGITEAVENNQGHNWLVMLNSQHRMHKDIADFVSESMYNGLLNTSKEIIDSRNKIAISHPCPKTAMALVDLSGLYSACIQTKDGSRVNVLSALICIRLAEKNIDKYEIGIITPYNAQSRLILSMIRELQEHDKRWLNVTCATVHQFQGSEKPIIIYDAVDCFRMQYPGMLLTEQKNNMANRLFNVALTRAEGKFILIANIDYFERKNISDKLIFKNAINQILQKNQSVFGKSLLKEIVTDDKENSSMIIKDKETSWKLFIKDISLAKKKIHIDMININVENKKLIKEFIKVLDKKRLEGLEICIRHTENIEIPSKLQQYSQCYKYTYNPITIIDKKIIWFGQPLYETDFISNHKVIKTEFFPCIRFEGVNMSKSLYSFTNIK